MPHDVARGAVQAWVGIGRELLRWRRMSRPLLLAGIPALVIAALSLSCRDEPKAPGGDTAAVAVPVAPEPAPVEARPDAKSAAEPAARRMCADFDACREGCQARKAGACERMHARARGKSGAEADKVAAQMCDAGHPEACHVQSLRTGDKSRATRALSRACDLGYGQGCIALAARTKNAGKARELRLRAYALLERYCRSENAYACAALGDAARQPAEDETADPARARWHYEKACNLGEEGACYSLAEELRGDHPAEGLTLLDRACELGEPRACAASGDEYAAGKHAEKNMQRAADGWQRACDSESDGAAEACGKLAAALKDGSLPADAGRAAAVEKRRAELAGKK
jgi:TPR repeat protein